jgi:hypothetical protein
MSPGKASLTRLPIRSWRNDRAGYRPWRCMAGHWSASANERHRRSRPERIR